MSSDPFGLVFLLAPDLPAGTLLGVLFSLYALFALSAGLTSTAWQDFIARVIPERTRAGPGGDRWAGRLQRIRPAALRRGA